MRQFTAARRRLIRQIWLSIPAIIGKVYNLYFTNLAFKLDGFCLSAFAYSATSPVNPSHHQSKHPSKFLPNVHSVRGQARAARDFQVHKRRCDCERTHRPYLTAPASHPEKDLMRFESALTFRQGAQAFDAATPSG